MRSGPIVEIIMVGRRVIASGAFVLLLAVAGAFALRASRAGAAVLVIDRGGTYSGTWESDDANVPCVRIATAEPVVIENATVRGRGDLIVSKQHQAKITIRNTR